MNPPEPPAWQPPHQRQPSQEPSGPQPPYGQPPYGQPPYGQPPYGQPPFGRAPWNQPRRPPHRGWTILVVAAVVVAIVAVIGIVVTNLPPEPPRPARTSTRPAKPLPTDFVPPKQQPPSNMPTPAASDRKQSLGPLAAAPRRIDGQGSVTLSYQRLAGNGTHLRFTCTGCDDDTWLVDRTRPWPLSGGPLPTPEEYEYVLDSVDPPGRTELHVKAPVKARWTLVLTPFDSVAAASATTIRGRDSRVVRVRTTGKSRLACASGPWVKTFFKAHGTAEYDVGWLMSNDSGGEWDLWVPDDADTMVAIISCRGPWTLTVP